MPVVGLKLLDLSSSNLGLLFASMGAGSVIGAVFIIPRLRVRLSPDSITFSANLLLVLVYVLMALVRQTEVFFVVAALAGVGWTMSASELWGGGAARDAKLGASPHERHSNHDLAGGDGAWGCDLGFNCYPSRRKLYLAWSGGSLPREPASGPSAFDQRHKAPRRSSLRLSTKHNTFMDQLAPSARLRLENQVAVVTGGARGIGAGIVRRFAQEGARVVFSDLLSEKGIS